LGEPSFLNVHNIYRLFALARKLFWGWITAIGTISLDQQFSWKTRLPEHFGIPKTSATADFTTHRTIKPSREKLAGSPRGGQSSVNGFKGLESLPRELTGIAMDTGSSVKRDTLGDPLSRRDGYKYLCRINYTKYQLKPLSSQESPYN
jgi:hypothetical protein